MEDGGHSLDNDLLISKCIDRIEPLLGCILVLLLETTRNVGNEMNPTEVLSSKPFLIQFLRLAKAIRNFKSDELDDLVNVHARKCS